MFVVFQTVSYSVAQIVLEFNEILLPQLPSAVIMSIKYLTQPLFNYFIIAFRDRVLCIQAGLKIAI